MEEITVAFIPTGPVPIGDVHEATFLTGMEKAIPVQNAMFGDLDVVGASRGTLS